MTESAPSSRHGNGRELAGEVKARGHRGGTRAGDSRGGGCRVGAEQTQQECERDWSGEGEC